MAEASSAGAGRERGQDPLPWTQAWIDALPVAPAWVGCAFTAGHLLLGALYFAFFVELPIGEAWSGYRGTAISTSVFALIVGYATTALAYARRAHEATLRDLRPALVCDDAELAELRRELQRFDLAALRWVGGIWGLGAVLVTYFSTGAASRLGHPAAPWILWQNGLCFWLLSRTIAHDLRVSGVFSHATQRHAEVDVLDLTPLTPLASRGLQSALLIVLALSLFSLILGAGDISPAVPVVQAATVLLAAYALVLPSLGVRRRVRDAKGAELARLAAAIRAARAPRAAAGEAERREDEAHLAVLLTLRQHVEAAREWPFDPGTWGRFVLYAVIGVGSWLGGAAVERLLDLLVG